MGIHLRPLVASTLLAAVVTAAFACNSPERLAEPFASLIPACEETTYAPQLELENQHQVESGELGLSYSVWERHCSGDDFNVFMAIRKFESEQDAHMYTINEPAPDYWLGFFQVDDPELRYPVDDLNIYGLWQFLGLLVPDEYEEDEGFAQTWLLFRRGLYVGTYTSSAKGEAIFPEGIVVADSRPDLAERLMNDTIIRWQLEQ